MHLKLTGSFISCSAVGWGDSGEEKTNKGQPNEAQPEKQIKLEEERVMN